MIKGVKPSEFVFLAVVKKRSAVPSTDSVCCFQVALHSFQSRATSEASELSDKTKPQKGVAAKADHAAATAATYSAFLCFPHFQNNKAHKAPVVSICFYFNLIRFQLHRLK